MSDALTAFVRESNLIEGITRDPTPNEIVAHRVLLRQGQISVAALQMLVGVCQPAAILRDRSGLNVRVGDHRPPPGSPEIRENLRALLDRVNSRYADPFDIHCRYQNLHPFTDGNGRSGRALWLWMMGGPEKAPLGFLHHFYYQSLSAQDRSNV